MMPFGRAWFEQLCADLASGDQNLIDHIASMQRAGQEPELRLLHSSSSMLRRLVKSPDPAEENPRQLPSLAPIRSISPPIVEYLSRIGSEDLLLAYRSQFPEAFCEEMALADEKLQVNTFDRWAEPTLNWVDWTTHHRHSGFHPRQKLNSFRLTQRIRNEHGIERVDSPPNCFRSFEDIIHLERDIEYDNIADCLLQCILLKLIDARHVVSMYMVTSNFPQLEKFHDGFVRQHGDTYSGGGGCRISLTDWYGKRFMFLARQRCLGGLPLMWQELKKYMKIYRQSYLNWLFYDVYVSDDELDDALNCTLNELLKIYILDAQKREDERASRFFKRLLDRGACLKFKSSDEKCSSYVALVRLIVEFHSEFFSLPEFEPHICCPLLHDRSYGVMLLDNRRVAPLFCIAAMTLC